MATMTMTMMMTMMMMMLRRRRTAHAHEASRFLPSDGGGLAPAPCNAVSASPAVHRKLRGR